MPATIEESIIKIGDKSYKKRDVVAKLVPVGQFLELVLMHKSEIIYVCSNDPSSPNYQNSIFEETTPQNILNACIGTIQVLGGLSLVIPTAVIQVASGLTQTYTKANHGFPVPSVVAWDGTDWTAADKDTTIDVFVVIAATANTFTVGLNGSHQVNHGLGNNPGPIYLGDPPNNLTRTAPPVGQVPKKQIILGQVLSSNHLWIQPEWRAS